jgi:hypothetical protein
LPQVIRAPTSRSTKPRQTALCGFAADARPEAVRVVTKLTKGKTMKRFLLTVVLVCLSGGLTTAQSMKMDMQANTRIINGADTPEQIPDTKAYFHVMYLLGKFAQDPANSLPSSMLQRLGFSTQEIPQARRILINFTNQYDADQAEFNKIATANDAKGLRTDKVAFEAKTEKLVADTRAELASAVGTNSLLNLHAFVLSEKKHMRIGVTQ